MKRFRRILVNGPVAISLLLCVGSVALWVRSYRRVDSVIHFRPERTYQTTWIDHVTTVTFRAGPVYEADSRRGRLRFVFLRSDGDYFRTEQPTWFSYDLGDDVFLSVPWSDKARLGFAIEHAPVPHFVYNAPPGPQLPAIPVDLFHAVYTPWWFWVMLFALPPAGRLLAARRRWARRRKGTCQECGYDLRASRERCPECGAAIAPAAQP